MNHLATLRSSSIDQSVAEVMVTKATGRYYTHVAIARELAGDVWKALGRTLGPKENISIIDPFAGDGRLVTLFIQHAISAGRRDLSWSVHLWDLDPSGLAVAVKSLRALSRASSVKILVESAAVDSFKQAPLFEGRFRVVLTNPPWELLKPDRRELQNLDTKQKAGYIAALREYDQLLERSYPASQPNKRFAGWGTNLARVGVEVALRLTSPEGILGIVSQSTLLADERSIALRRWMLSTTEMRSVAFFPAEARLFGRADVSCVTIVLVRRQAKTVAPQVRVYDAQLNVMNQHTPGLSAAHLRRTGYVVPVSFGVGSFDVLASFSSLPEFGYLEAGSLGLWAGRELDETGSRTWLRPTGDGLFIKGRMIDRFTIVEPPTAAVSKPQWAVPRSVLYERLVWRDVSRSNQKRRIKATIIPKGWIAGNSLGVAYFRDGNPWKLRLLLGVMSSFAFEFQLRAYLGTGHISLTALRRVHLPALSSSATADGLVSAVEDSLSGSSGAEAKVEAAAAYLYGLSRDTLVEIMRHFPKVTESERERVLAEYDQFPLRYNEHG